jgi:hypothetical protein
MLQDDATRSMATKETRESSPDRRDWIPSSVNAGKPD